METPVVIFSSKASNCALCVAASYNRKFDYICVDCSMQRPFTDLVYLGDRPPPCIEEILYGSLISETDKSRVFHTTIITKTGKEYFVGKQALNDRTDLIEHEASFGRCVPPCPFVCAPLLFDDENNVSLSRYCKGGNLRVFLQSMYEKVGPAGILCVAPELGDINRQNVVERYSAITETPNTPGILSEETVRTVVFRLLQAVRAMHAHGAVHADIKPDNIFLYEEDDPNTAVLGDFGNALYASIPGSFDLDPETVTGYIGALPYRAPELLIGAHTFGSAIDIWSIGCVMAEMLLGAPLFVGKTVLEQIERVSQVLGGWLRVYPDVVNAAGYTETIQTVFEVYDYSFLIKLFPMLSREGYIVLKKMLTINPKYRPTADELLRELWFINANHNLTDDYDDAN